MDSKIKLLSGISICFIIPIIIAFCISPENTPPERLSFQDTEVESDSFCTCSIRRSLGIFQITILLDAIEYVESKGNINAIGDNGQAVGCMQIHPIMVKDVNRILGYNKFVLDDRYNREKSRNMCKIYMSHYCKNMNFENMAACWIAGPDGYLQKNKPAVKKYIEKINEYLANLQ